MEALMNDFSAPEVIREAAMTLKHVNTYDKLKAIIYDKRLEEIVFREELHLQFIHGIKKGEENMGEVVRKAQEEVRKAQEDARKAQDEKQEEVRKAQEDARKAQEDARKAQKSLLAKMSSSLFHVPYHEIESLFENLSQEQTDSLAEVLFTFSTLEELKAYLSLLK
jgi:glutamyl-tRNA reductase